MTDFDVSELNQLERDLGSIPGRMVGEQIGQVEKSAKRVQRDWRKKWRGHRHAPHLPAAVTYDVKVKPGEVSAEIGPDKSRKQGALGNIFEYGTSNNPPIPGGGPALKAEEPRLVKDVEKFVEDLL